ncbi:MAG: hypothetical protein U0802_05065 [Candidatus Binatia bacterium]
MSYKVLRELLAALDLYLPQGGTDYAAMLRAAVDAFGAPGDGERYLVVLSDGEAHDQAWQRLLPTLRERGIRVIGLGVGTPAGALVPAPDGGVLKDAAGSAVLSKLEPATLRQLAEQTGGAYRDAATWVDVAELVDGTVALGHAGEYVEDRGVRLQDRFQWFLAPALLLVLLSFWLERRSRHWRARSTRGRRPHRGPLRPSRRRCSGSSRLGESRARQALAVATDPPPPSVATAPSAPHLPGTIAELSAKAALDATDFAPPGHRHRRVRRGRTPARGAARDGIIDDALAAVDRGERRDAQAADWPALRARLESAAPAAEQPPSPQQDQPPQQQEQSETQPDSRAAPAEQGQRQAGGGQSPGQDGRQGKATRPRARTRPGENRDAKAGSAIEAAGASAQRRRPLARHRRPATWRADDAKPLDAAGLGDEPPRPADDPAAVGDRRRRPGRAWSAVARVAAEAPSDDPATADALARMARVKSSDAPAVLFDRMNRAEGQPRSNDDGKNW